MDLEHQNHVTHLFDIVSSSDIYDDILWVG
jgi:hypothetical protein